MKLSKLINLIEKIYPLNAAEEWDNVGLLVGSNSLEVKKVQFSLDLTEEALDKAIAEEADLIITHHPLIFKKLNKITNETIVGKKILKLIENKIALYSIHTNLDASSRGLNNLFIERLGEKPKGYLAPKTELRSIFQVILTEKELKKLKKQKRYQVEILENNLELRKEITKDIKTDPNQEKIGYKKCRVEGKSAPINQLIKEYIDGNKKIDNQLLDFVVELEEGIGSWFELEVEKSLKIFVEELKDKLNLDTIRVVKGRKKIKRVGVVTGSGISFAKTMKRKKIDTLITGDVKYHEALDLKELGYNIIDVGHYESEVFFSECLIKNIWQNNGRLKLLEELEELKKVEYYIYNSERVFEAL